MSEPAYQTASVSCPNCRTGFVTPVMTVIDTLLQPEAKDLLLSGRLNVAVCPQCGHAGALSAPLVYHDPDKELLLTFVPSELGLSELEQQQLIGDLTNRIISALPPEQRKGYLLQPRSFLQLEALLTSILEADGVTPEMLEAQRAKTALLSQLIQTTDKDVRRGIVKENDDQIDSLFLQLLTLNMEVAQANESEEMVQQLQTLFEQLMDWTSTGREVTAREEAIRELGNEVSREGLLEKLVKAALADERIKVETMVTLGRAAIDYVFYQQLTTHMEAAEASGDADRAQKLKELREYTLDLVAQIDAEAERATREAAEFLQQLIESPDPEKLVQEDFERVDELLLSVLGASLDAANREGRTEDMEKLSEIGDMIVKLIQVSQPPEVQFINALLSADYPDGTQTLLEDNGELLDDRLFEYMRLVGEDLRESGRTETAERLAEIQEQAAAVVKDGANPA